MNDLGALPTKKSGTNQNIHCGLEAAWLVSFTSYVPQYKTTVARAIKLATAE